MQPNVAARPRLAVKILLFLATVALAGMISWLKYRNGSLGLEILTCSLVCALPIFAVLTWTLRKRGILGTVLPLLVFPLVFTLLFVDIGYDSSPQSYFRSYILDPIPEGVTDIEVRDYPIGESISSDIVIIFKATPEIIDTIITQDHWEKADIPNFSPDWDLPEYTYMGDWTGYQQRYYTNYGDQIDHSTRMWVDHEESIVVFYLQRLR
jgi:hypothetical protein